MIYYCSRRYYYSTWVVIAGDMHRARSFPPPGCQDFDPDIIILSVSGWCLSENLNSIYIPILYYYYGSGFCVAIGPNTKFIKIAEVRPILCVPILPWWFTSVCVCVWGYWRHGGGFFIVMLTVWRALTFLCSRDWSSLELDCSTNKIFKATVDDRRGRLRLDIACDPRELKKKKGPLYIFGDLYFSWSTS